MPYNSHYNPGITSLQTKHPLKFLPCIASHAFPFFQINNPIFSISTTMTIKLRAERSRAQNKELHLTPFHFLHILNPSMKILAQTLYPKT